MFRQYGNMLKRDWNTFGHDHTMFTQDGTLFG